MKQQVYLSSSQFKSSKSSCNAMLHKQVEICLLCSCRQPLACNTPNTNPTDWADKAQTCVMYAQRACSCA